MIPFIALIILIWLAVNALAVWIALHPPRTPSLSSPGAIGAPQEIVSIKSHELIELSGWWVQGEDPNSVAILCHGYLLSKGELAPVAYNLWQQGMSCLLFDFRGHGKSDSGRIGLGFLEKADVESAVEWVKRRNPNARIVLIGSSMGSVASAVAWSENPELVEAMVFDSGYANLGKAVGGWWKFVGGSWLALLLWPAARLGVLFLGFNPFAVRVPEYLETLRGRPVLFMHGTDDPVVSVKQAGKNLYALGPGAEAIWFDGCSHSEGRWEQPETYRSALLRFLRTNQFISPEIEEIHSE